jgi:hypothetical protein
MSKYAYNMLGTIMQKQRARQEQIKQDDLLEWALLIDFVKCEQPVRTRQT